MNNDKEIFVVTDYLHDYDLDHMLQITSKAKELVLGTKMSVTAICIGEENKKQFHNLFIHGVDQIVFCEQTRKCDVTVLSDIVASIIEQKNPKVVLFAATEYGRMLAAILSTRFEAGLTAECIEVSVGDNGEFEFSRAAINESVIAKIKCINCSIQMCTIKSGVFAIQRQSNRDNGEIIYYEYKSNDLKICLPEILSKIKCGKEQHVDIEKAMKVFCIGRGVKDQSLVEKLFKIAKKCGAEVVGTRAAVDEGLIEKERQVGQSGKNISPQIYVGFGVSGASQHMVGIKNADIVVAVNYDKAAHIFDYADYVIVDDLYNVINKMGELVLA